MGIKKGLAIVGAGIALNAAAVNAGNLNEMKVDVNKDIEKNIQYTPNKPKGSAIDIAKLFTTDGGKDKNKNKKNKNDNLDSAKTIQATKEWDAYEEIKNINFSENFLYVEFTYKNAYKVKYEYNKKGENDLISIKPLQGDNKEYPFSFMNSLFTGNIINHYIKEAPKKTSKKEPEKTVIDTTGQQKEITRHRESVIKRIELCIKFQDIIQKECKTKNRTLDTENDPPYIQSGVVYFCVEKKEDEKSKIKKDEEDILYMSLVEKKQAKLDKDKKPILDENKNPVYETILTSKLISADKYIMSARTENLKQPK